MPGRLARLILVITAVAAVVVVVVDVDVAVAAVTVAITVLPAVGPHALLPLTEGIAIVVVQAQVRVEDARGVDER